jgi:hypothetical protein
LNAVDQRTISKSLRLFWWSLFALIALIAIAIRIRLLGIPLERDEGEYAYAGQLMLQGIPPYQLAYNMKFPGTYAAYALIMSIFGQTIVGIHLGLLIVNAATIALLFLLGRRLFGEIAGIAAAASYAILSVSPTVLGFAGHATHFVVLAAVGGALLLLIALDRQSHVRLFLSGILFGIGVIMKQPGAAFVAFGLGYALFHAWKKRSGLRTAIVRSVTLVGGAILPFALTCLVLLRAGVFEKFWFWSIEYARAYGTRVSLPVGAEAFAENIGRVIGSSGAIWLLAAIGLAICIWNFKSGLSHVFSLGLFFFSAAAVSAGLYFRQHYFILALPVLSLFAGTVASYFSQWKMLRFVSLAVFVGAISLPLFAKRDFFFSLPMDAASRLTSGPNPFPESVRIARFLRDRTEPNDTIAVLGSEPQIYFYANRHSATGYIYIYPLMEPHPFAAHMQEEMVREIEAARPKYVVFVSVETSWLIEPDSKRRLFDWFADYSERELKPAGMVNIISETRTDYYLPYASESVTPSPYRITIYERKS